MEVLVGFGVVALLTAVVGIVGVRRYFRVRKALSEPVGTSECVACHSADLTTFAAECYRCVQCGFTWGPGLQAYASSQRVAKLEGLGKDERRKIAIRELEDASGCLLAARELLRNAEMQVARDLLRTSDSPVELAEIRNECIRKAVGEMMTTQNHIRYAAEAVGYALQGARGSVDFDAEKLALDAHVDSITIDRFAKKQIDELQAHRSEMEAAVARALEVIRTT